MIISKKNLIKRRRKKPKMIRKNFVRRRKSSRLLKEIVFSAHAIVCANYFSNLFLSRGKFSTGSAQKFVRFDWLLNKNFIISILFVQSAVENFISLSVVCDNREIFLILRDLQISHQFFGSFFAIESKTMAFPALMFVRRYVSKFLPFFCEFLIFFGQFCNF